MAFRKIRHASRRPADADDKIRYSYTQSSSPMFRVPMSILTEIGLRQDALIDIMIDDDISDDVQIAIVSLGTETKVTKIPGQKGLITSSRLRGYLPASSTVVVPHSIDVVDGRPAIIIRARDISVTAARSSGGASDAD